MKKMALFVWACFAIVLAHAAPPGNALNLDGSNDRVSVASSSSLNFGTATDFTIEAWVRITASLPDYSGVVVKGTTPANWVGYQLVIVGNRIAGEIKDGVTQIGVAQGLQGTTLLNDSRWHHLAMVVTRSSKNIQLFVDGVREANVTNNPASNNPLANSLDNASSLLIGTERTSGLFLNGSVDEVRIWNVARTQAQLQASMYNTISASSSNLVAYYDFETGTAGGSNTGLTTLTDRTTNGNNGTLVNFALTGAGSNWVESYAIVVPAVNSTRYVYSTGFTVSWTAPAIGTVDNYQLYVGTAATFQSNVTNGTFVSGYNGLSVTGTSATVTGLATGTTYYYWVCASKSGIAGQGGFYPATSVVPALSATPTMPTLTLSAGTLSPSYSSATTSYTTCVANGVSSLTVTPTTQANSTVKVNSTSVASGAASGAIALSVGTNTISVVVTAENNSTTGTYTITVYRAAATPSITAGGATSFCSGNSVTLTSSSASNNQWYLNGSSISGATSQSYTAATDGSYTVIVSSNSCASVASAATVVSVSTTGGCATSGSLNLKSGDYATLNSNSVGNFGTTDFTIEGWIKTTALTTPILSKRVDCNHGSFWDILMQNGKLRFEYENGSDVDHVNYTTTATYNDGNWHHFALTRSGNQGRIYIDGSLVSTQTANTGASTGGTANISNTAYIQLGTSPCTPYFGNYAGGIDEIRIWNYARSAGQLSTRRTCELTGRESGLLLYYKCNQGAAGVSNAGQTTLIDATTYGNNATMTNFTLSGYTSNWVYSTALATGTVCTNNWTGTTSSDWNTATNWSYGTVPDANDVVVIPAGGLPNEPALPSSSSIYSLEVVSGRTLTLNNDLTVAGTLNLNGGMIDLGAKTLTVNSITGGSSSSFAVTNGTGSLKVKALNGTQLIPIGVSSSSYSPITITSGESLDWTIGILNSFASYPALNQGSALQRIWNITPSTTPTTQGVTVQFAYPDALWTTPSSVNVYRYAVPGGWQLTGANGTALTTSLNGAMRTVTLTGQNKFSPFAISGTGTPLPVRWLSFTANREGANNVLRWKTASEANNLGFHVERSEDGERFQTIGFVSAGSSGNGSAYSFSDRAGNTARIYYRLGQVDLGGAYSFSRTLMLSGSSAPLEVLRVFPNPVAGDAQIDLQVSKEGPVTLEILSASGQPVRLQTRTLGKGAQTLTLDWQALPAGVYFLRVKDASGNQAPVIRVVRQ